jgi:hypothetical protein
VTRWGWVWQATEHATRMFCCLQTRKPLQQIRVIRSRQLRARQHQHQKIMAAGLLGRKCGRIAAQ